MEASYLYHCTRLHGPSWATWRLLHTGDQAPSEDNCLHTAEGPFSDGTHCPLRRTGFTSAAEPQEECMFTLRTLKWVILIIKVQNILLRLEAKFLIQQHGRVAR